MLTNIRIQNYKALKDVSIEFTPLHLLIGPNDSGKTSIQQILFALFSSVDKELSQCFPGRWKGPELVWQQRKDLDVNISSSFRDDKTVYKYELALNFLSEDKRVTLSKEIILKDNEEVNNIVHNARQTVVKMTNSGNKVISNEAKFNQLMDFHSLLTGVHSYHWDPRYLALPAAVDTNWQFRMEPTGFGLSRCLDDILGYDRTRFNDLEARFLQYFPEFRSIKLVTEQAFTSPAMLDLDIPNLQKTQGKGLYFELKTDGSLISASNASDGILLVLAYLTILFVPKPPRLLLIEEPENGIHPRRIKEVLSIIRDIVQEQNYTQIVMTTHSPYVVDEFQPSEVTLCRKRQDGSVLTKQLSTSETVKNQLNIFGLGEIWASEGEQELASEASKSEEVNE